MKDESLTQQLALFLDTSLKGYAIAIGSLTPGQDRFLSQSIETVSHRTLQHLPTSLQKLLAESQTTLDQLQAVVVSVGPGSFTGIKIGLAFSQGLLKGRPTSRNKSEAGLKVLGVSSLACLGESLASSNYLDNLKLSECVLVWPSTRTHGYALRLNGTVAEKQATLVSIGPAVGAVAIDDFVGTCNQMLLGDTWTEMQSYATQRQWNVQTNELRINLEAALKGMHTEAVRQWPHGFGEHVPEPQYLRPSTAEEKLLQMEKGI